jgi:hypothetical protein
MLCPASRGKGKVGDREVLIDLLWSAIEASPDPRTAIQRFWPNDTQDCPE